MKSLYTYMYEGILSGADALSSDVDEYANTLGWVKTYVRGVFQDDISAIPIQDNEVDIYTDKDSGKTGVWVEQTHGVYFTLNFEKDCKIPDNIVFIGHKENGLLHMTNLRGIRFVNDPNIKDIKNISKICKGALINFVKFVDCSPEYITKTINNINKAFKKIQQGFGGISIKNQTSTQTMDLTDCPDINIDEISTPKADVILNIGSNLSPHSNDTAILNRIKCKKLYLKSQQEHTLYINYSSIKELDIDGIKNILGSDSKFELRINDSNIYNLKDIIEEVGLSRLVLDGTTIVRSKVKDCISQYDILGQEVKEGDFVLSPVFNSNSMWGNSGLRLMCSKIVSSTGKSICNGYKNIDSKIVLKVPEKIEMRTNLQEPNITLNKQTLKEGDIVAYCDGEGTSNRYTHVEVGRVEKIGKLITVKGSKLSVRRQEANALYKIDKDWLKKNDKNKKFKELY